MLDHLGINKATHRNRWVNGWNASFTIRTSMYPDKSHSAIPIACSASHSAQNIALNELGRQAIMADPNWKKEKFVA